MSDKSIIQLFDVTKRYGRSTASAIAVNGISLDIGQGEFLTITGPSGSGKTTILNLITGLDSPTSGRVVVAGQDLASLADRQLSQLRLTTMGYVFQSFNLIPALTVERNVSWPLNFAGLSGKEARARARESLHRVGITDYEDRYPSDMAGGEQQRVAIARAIAGRPAILIADEPTGNLDTQTGRRVLDLLRDLNQHEAVTVVMVTHDLLAAACGDRTIEVQDGKVVQEAAIPRWPESHQSDSTQ